MPEEIPVGDKAIFGFLEMIALAFAFEGAGLFLHGGPWRLILQSALLSLLFFYAGLKVTVVRKLYYDLLDRVNFESIKIARITGLLFVLIVILYLFYLFRLWDIKVLYADLAWIDETHQRWFYYLLGANTMAVFIFAGDSLARRRERATVSRDLTPKGFLEHKLDAETALVAMPRMMTALSKLMGEIGPSMGKHAESLQRASSTAQQLKIAERASASLDKYSARVNRLQAKYIPIGESFCVGWNGWWGWMQGQALSRDDLAVHEKSMRYLDNSLDGSVSETARYINALARIKGSSRTWDAAINRHIEGWGKILDFNLRLQKVCRNTINIIEGLP